MWPSFFGKSSSKKKLEEMELRSRTLQPGKPALRSSSDSPKRHPSRVAFVDPKRPYQYQIDGGMESVDTPQDLALYIDREEKLKADSRGEQFSYEPTKKRQERDYARLMKKVNQEGIPHPKKKWDLPKGIVHQTFFYPENWTKRQQSNYELHYQAVDHDKQRCILCSRLQEDLKLLKGQGTQQRFAPKPKQSPTRTSAITEAKPAQVQAAKERFASESPKAKKEEEGATAAAAAKETEVTVEKVTQSNDFKQVAGLR